MKRIAMLLLSAVALAKADAAPLQWTCDWPEAKSQTFSLYQGETATFEPTFRVNGRTVTNATIEAVWYTTNFVGTTGVGWWRLDNATFAPSNDFGAASYRFFVEAKTSETGETGGTSGRQTIYRANGTLRMLPSPGFEPSTVQLPARSLDFAAIDYSNAPWPAEIESATNELATTLSDSILALSDTKADKSDATLTPVYSQTPTFSEWTILRDGVDVTSQVGQPVWDAEWNMSESIVSGDIAPSGTSLGENVTTLSWSAEYPGPDDMETAYYTATRVRTDIIGYTLGSQTNKVLQAQGDYATIDDIPDVSDFATREEVEPAVTAYPRVYSFILGATNANFAVTNYQLTAEADAERMHFDPSDTDLDFSTVPSSLRLEDASTGTNRVVVDSRDWTVWYYAQKIGKAIHTASTNAIETCRAWVNFTATGEENPIDDTLIVDVPNIWLMAGKTFEKRVASSNSCWVIRSKDVAVPISDNAQSAGGFLELTDAFGEPYIRFNKTDSYFVDPPSDGVSFVDGEWQILYSTTNCPTGGANAVIEGSTTYPGKAILKAEDDPDCPATITWTGSANNWVMHAVPKPVGGVVPPKMFFGAVVEVEGQDYIEYLRPMSIPHLLVDGVKIAPEIPASHPVGTTIPWKVVQ